MTDLDPALVERAHELIARCDLGVLEEDAPPYGSSDFAQVEHTMHEIAHALLLGLPLRVDLSRSIGMMLGDNDAAVTQEARAWIVEYRATQILGVPLEWGEVIDHAEIQGCTPTHIAEAQADESLHEYADRLVRIMRGDDDES